jgi:hypothetical protein
MHSGRCAVGYPFELIGREQVVPKAVRLVPIFAPTATPMRFQVGIRIAAAPAAVAAAPARIRTVAILATVRCPTATVARQHATGAHRMRRPLRFRHPLSSQSQKFLGRIRGLWRTVLGAMATLTAVLADLDFFCHLLLFPVLSLPLSAGLLKTCLPFRRSFRNMSGVPRAVFLMLFT